MENSHRIYKITNLVNGKIYIGLTIKSIQKRLKGHFNTAKSGAPWAISSAIRKYGTKNFIIEEICQCANLEEANKLEFYWVNKLRSNESTIGYNLTNGGDGSKAHTQETLEKLRIANLGENNPQYGIPHTAEWCRRQSEFMSSDRNPMKNPEIAKKTSKSLSGANSYNYIDGRKKGVHYCVANCGNTISYSNFTYGSKLCRVCCNTGERNPSFGRKIEEDERKRRSEASKLMWKNQEYREKMSKRGKNNV